MKKANCKSGCTASCPCQCVRPKRRKARPNTAPRRNPIADLVTALLTQKLQEGMNKPPMFKPQAVEKRIVSTDVQTESVKPSETRIVSTDVQTESVKPSETRIVSTDIQTESVKPQIKTGGKGSRGPYKPRQSQVQILADRLQVLEKGMPRSRSVESTPVGEPGSMSGITSPMDEPMNVMRKRVLKVVRSIPPFVPKTTANLTEEEKQKIPLFSSREEAKERIEELKALGVTQVRVAKQPPASVQPTSVTGGGGGGGVEVPTQEKKGPKRGQIVVDGKVVPLKIIKQKPAPALTSVVQTLQEATDKASTEGEQKVDFS